MLRKEKRLIYIGSDHAGYEMKNDLKVYLNDKFELVDLGVFSTASFDYPDIAREVGEKVLEGKDSLGILICGTGTGMAMSANKLRGIRAASCTSVEMAEMARRHNNANIVTLGARIIALDLAKAIVDKFIEADFEKDEERHVRRVQKMDALRDLK